MSLGVKDNTKGREKAVTGCAGYNIAEIKSRIYEATDPKILVDVEELYLEACASYTCSPGGGASHCDRWNCKNKDRKGL